MSSAVPTDSKRRLFELRKFTFLVVMAAMVVALGVAWAATEIDVTVDPFEYTINGALFTLGTFRSSGTGVFDPFVRISANGTEQGYNSDLTSKQFDEKGGIWTHSLQLNTVPTFTIDSLLYREFRLDVNQSANAPISLDALRIYQSNDPLLSPYASGLLGGLDAIYNMDELGDYWVSVPSGTGSGQGDLGLYVLNSLFNPNQQYVELYSYFGTNIASNDGFEEWGVIKGEQPPPLIPESSSILLALSGLPTVGMMGWLRLRRKRQSG